MSDRGTFEQPNIVLHLTKRPTLLSSSDPTLVALHVSTGVSQPSTSHVTHGLSRASLLVVFVLLFASCAASGSHFDEHALPRLIPGTTTETQAISILGSQPHQRIRYADGSHLSVWSYAEVFLANVNSKAVSILFDSRNVMVRFVAGVNVPALPQAATSGTPSSIRMVGVAFGNRLPNGDFLLEVTIVQPGSLAEKAGWRVGDLVLAVDGRPVANSSEFVTANQQGEPIKKYSLRRGEQLIETEISFGGEGN